MWLSWILKRILIQQEWEEENREAATFPLSRQGQEEGGNRSPIGCAHTDRHFRSYIAIKESQGLKKGRKTERKEKRKKNRTPKSQNRTKTCKSYSGVAGEPRLKHRVERLIIFLPKLNVGCERTLKWRKFPRGCYFIITKAIRFQFELFVFICENKD